MAYKLSSFKVRLPKETKYTAFDKKRYVQLIHLGMNNISL